jgi:hypothetical protein
MYPYQKYLSIFGVTLARCGGTIQLYLPDT